MSRIPTPGDLATRAHRPLAAQAPPFRPRFEAAIRNSHLHSRTRLVALVLATYASHQTGGITAAVHPGYERLALASGLSNHSVRVGLQELQEHGLVERDRGPSGQAVQITLTLPAGDQAPQ